MLKTLLTSFGSQPGMITDEVDDKFEGRYSSSESADGNRSIKQLTKSKNFKNPKAKNY